MTCHVSLTASGTLPFADTSKGQHGREHADAMINLAPLCVADSQPLTLDTEDDVKITSMNPTGEQFICKEVVHHRVVRDVSVGKI